MKKIVLVTDAWKPQRNGVVTVQNALMTRLEAQGYTVHVIEPEQFKTVPLPLYPEIHLALFPRRRVAKLLDSIQPDAIHIMTEGPLGWAARAVCMKRGLPFTTWYHTHLQLYVKVYLRGFLRPIHALLRRFHSTATRTMVSTASLKRELEASGFRENIVVVPLGVDIALFSHDVAPSLTHLPKPIFTYFGRLASEKSPEDFLKLALPGTKVVMGDGPLLPKLKKKYPDAHFLGRYKVGKDFAEKVSSCDVFVFPSKTETFGLVTLEALASGVPVAAYDVMGPRDIITEGVDGCLSDDLQEAAMQCLTLSRDACRKKAEQFSWDRSTETFVQNLVPVR